MMDGSGGKAVAAQSGEGRVLRKKKVTKFSENEKENFDIHEGRKVTSNETKSPLPAGYPRLPLQDITSVLQPINKNISDEDQNDSSTGMRKPLTTSQSSKDGAKAHKKYRGNTKAVSMTKSKKKQVVVKITVGEEIKSQTTVESMDVETKLKQEAINLTINLSNSIQLTEYASEAEPAVNATLSNSGVEASASGCSSKESTNLKVNREQITMAPLKTSEARERDAEQEQPEDPIAPITRNLGTQDPKRRKALSNRSKVSSFR